MIYWIIVGSFVLLILLAAYAMERKRARKRYPEEYSREAANNAMHAAEKEAASRTWMDLP
ncbi:hypothetical protein G3578_08135 [Brevibacillus sp. SYP-B805]|uniref:hypothetical protein n=1 Tax=Brevibacillus sp. SYP-B805 TaxID=1578199 RepID=UPI0013E9E010|nr:hypothetical protein [Brevibacillus sp. SYP-B805]NGQ95134.1 hypothetical protein [Brevibacillus sp. SYP-B805]